MCEFFRNLRDLRDRRHNKAVAYVPEVAKKIAYQVKLELLRFAVAAKTYLISTCSLQKLARYPLFPS